MQQSLSLSYITASTTATKASVMSILLLRHLRLWIAKKLGFFFLSMGLTDSTPIEMNKEHLFQCNSFTITYFVHNNCILMTDMENWIIRYRDINAKFALATRLQHTNAMKLYSAKGGLLRGTIVNSNAHGYVLVQCAALSTVWQVTSPSRMGGIYTI